MLKILAVRDRAVDAFGQPMTVPHVGLAIRSFGDEMKNDKSSFSQHPEDYDLYVLGGYDEQTGQLIPEPGGPKMVAVGKDYQGV